MNTRKINIDSEDVFKYRHNVYSVPPCNAYSRHSHNLYEMLYFRSGDASYIIEDKRYKLKQGDLIIIRPSEYHFIQIDSNVDYQRQNILFDHRKLGIDVSRLPSDLDVVNVKEGSVIDDIFEKLDYYSTVFENVKDFEAVAVLLIQEIIYNLALVKEEERAARFSVINPLLSKALAYIAEHLLTISDIGEVAQAVFVTESYLYRLFKKELLKSPKKYINEKRLLYAQTQLKKGKKPTEVAALSGFDDYTTFYRNYSAHFGKSPSNESANI